MKRPILILIVLLSFLSHPQLLSAISVNGQDTIILKDTAHFQHVILDYETVKTYIGILEKTNEQLSLWMNPYAIIIAVLALLFTVMAIIAAYLIFKQSSDSRKLIEDSIAQHRIALENIWNEKQNQWKIYEANIERLTLELHEKSATADPEKAQIVNEIIQKLELQKRSLEKEMITYQHSGWGPRDIQVQVEVNELTNFYLKIKLDKIGQEFCVYCKVFTNMDRSYWLGFGGNIQSKPERFKGEFTRHQKYGSEEIIIQENIYSAFTLGFGQSNEKVVNINYVRLRASDNIPAPIIFEFTFL